MKRYGVRPSVRLSVCLSVPSIDRCSSVRRVAAVGLSGGRHRSTVGPPGAAAARRTAANASSVMSSADVGSRTQTCWIIVWALELSATGRATWRTPTKNLSPRNSGLN